MNVSLLVFVKMEQICRTVYCLYDVIDSVHFIGGMFVSVRRFGALQYHVLIRKVYKKEISMRDSDLLFLRKISKNGATRSQILSPK